MDIRLADVKINATPTPEVKAQASSFNEALSFKQVANNAAPSLPSVGQSADPPSKLKVSVEAAFGRAVQLPPLDTSPWAINGQVDIYIPNDSVTSEISLGGQFTKNIATSPNKKTSTAGSVAENETPAEVRPRDVSRSTGHLRTGMRLLGYQ